MVYQGFDAAGERKSVEPMAARVAPEQVYSAHQSRHRLLARAPWSDEAMLSAVARRVLPELIAPDDDAVH
ncbi:MAG: transposase [Haliea sp.]|nr:transposase [Haliea sp.]